MISDGESLASAIGRLKERPDDFWWQYILKKDPLYAKIPPAARQELIVRALACAEEQYHTLQRSHGRRPAGGYAAELGIKIAAGDLRTDFDYVFISCYTAGPPLITLADTALDALAALIARENLPDLLSRAGLAELAVGHELFHHLEDITPGIYTRQKSVAYRALGILGYRICPVSAGEIAAVRFSQLMAGLSYSPAIYEILLLFLQNTATARKVLNDLLSTADSRQ